MVHALRIIASFALLSAANGAVIQKVSGANKSEVAHASSGGGAHLYLTGTDIGSAFAPPKIYIGVNADAECEVQPFTSNRNRLHCIISAAKLPPPDPVYAPAGRFVQEPLRVYAKGRLAACWHVGGANHGCFLTFDVGATPRVLRVLTSEVESGSMLRVKGQGIDGGLQGDPKIFSTLFRGMQLAVGACGQKDCAASNMGTETIGCVARLGGEEGDRVLGQSQNNAIAVAYSDATSYGCQMDELAGGLTGGFFNVSVYLNDDLHRGNAYFGFSSSARVDHATGGVFQAELLPRITGISPIVGSAAGGADLTISGTGFGSLASDVQIAVAGVNCVVTTITESAVMCRVQPVIAPPVAPQATLGSEGLPSYMGERGVRWQWAADGHVLLPTFSTPSQHWDEVAATDGTSYIEAWFEAPVDGAVTFLLRLDAVSTLY